MIGRKKVLVVDDAPPVRLMLQGYLAKLGIRADDISVAEDGEAGLRAFEEKRPDLVFVDIEMPVMNGEEAATRMLSQRPDIKVVVMTGVDETDSRIKQLRSWGVFAVLLKPVRFDLVKAVIDLVEAEECQLERIR